MFVQTNFSFCKDFIFHSVSSVAHFEPVIEPKNLYCLTFAAGFWGFERTERNKGRNDVAYLSIIHGLAFFPLFSNSLRIFRDIIRNFVLCQPIFASLGGSLVSFCRQGLKICHKNLPKSCGQHDFFWRIILKFDKLQAAFQHFDAFLLFIDQSQKPLPCLIFHPWFLLTMPKNLGCRKIFAVGKLAKQWEKHCIFWTASGDFWYFSGFRLTELSIHFLQLMKHQKIFQLINYRNNIFEFNSDCDLR